MVNKKLKINIIKMRSYYSFLLALCALTMYSQMAFAWTVNVTHNNESGIRCANSVMILEDGTVLGFFIEHDDAFFCGAISDKTEIIIPDTLVCSTKMYLVRKLNTNPYLYCDFSKASKVTTLYLPTTLYSSSLEHIHPQIKILHMSKGLKCEGVNSLYQLDRVFVPKEELSLYLNDLEWRRRVIILEEGKDLLKLTINVNKAGEFAKNVLQKTDNWNKVNELKVIGSLNEDDINKIKKMCQLKKLDLSEAKFDNFPNSFCEWKFLSSYPSDYCYFLSEVILPKISGIGEKAFYSHSLEKITISKVRTIGDHAFHGCNLSQISLPEGITAIGVRAFANNNIENVVLPSSMSSISVGCFDECGKLKSAVVPPSIKSIGAGAFYETGLNSISLPGVKRIGSHAFYGCKQLEKVQLAEELECLYDDPFYGCESLTEIDLPKSLEIITNGLLYGCKKIKKIICRAVIPPFLEEGTILGGVDITDVKLYVPALSVENYRKATGWKRFNTIIPLTDEITNAEICEEITIDDNAHLANECNIELCCRYNAPKHANAWWSYGIVNYIGHFPISIGNYTQIHYLGKTFSNVRPYYSTDNRLTSLIANGLMSADSVSTTLTISKNNDWYFISLPYDVNVSDITYTDGAQFVIRKYSGQNRAQREGETWLNLTSNSVMHAYEGYILQCNTPDATFTFPAINNKKKNNVFAMTDVNVPIKEYPSEFDHNRSWNLVGNPYPCYFDTRKMMFLVPFTVWNRRYHRYDAYSPVDDSYILHPTQAFFVQCPIGMSSILFDESGRQTDTTVKNLGSKSFSSRGLSSKSARKVYNVFLSDGEAEDHTRFVINKDATMDYELDKDASKFIDSNNTAMLVYTVEDGVRYAINERPLDKKVVRLGYYAPADGEYTLSLNTEQNDYIVLVDTENNTRTPLVGEVSFNATAGFNDSRFVLVIGKDATGIETVEDTASQWNISNGVVTAKEPFEIYTVEGHLIGKFGAETPIKLSAGIYLLNMKNIKQKIVVK